jgi:hypothetical protein
MRFYTSARITVKKTTLLLMCYIWQSQSSLKTYISHLARVVRFWYKKSLAIPKGKIRIHKWKKDRQYNGQMKRDKELTTIYKTLCSAPEG